MPLLVLIGVPSTVRAQAYDVAVFGDMPYAETAATRAFYLPKYHGLLESISKSTVAFAVHLGDYTKGPFCGDSVVNLRYAEFQNVQKPLVFVFGDNDWTDCARGGFQPLERLQKLRQVFTQGNTSLGKSRITLVRQSETPQFKDFRENVRWTHGQEMYVALNVTGSHNNWGKRAAPSAEYVTRNAANLAFLREAFQLATRENKRGIAVFIQANPGLNSLPDEPRNARETRGFDDFLRELQQLTIGFGKPVVLFHGDTHYFRIDKPLFDRFGHTIPNFTRVEAFGHPNYYWVRVHVDPRDPDVFSFRLVRADTPR
jgi:predicted phosphodiesterase